MQFSKHLLKPGQTIKQFKCPKNSQNFASGQPDTLVIHYTAGRNGESSAKYLARDAVKASAHIVIDRDGTIFQLVPFDVISWHAGKSEYNGRSGYNQFSIGIEVDNAGVLEKSGNEFISWFGKKYPPEEVIEAVHRNENKPRYWHIYTPEQIDAVEELCTSLIHQYPTIKQILGHEEISPGRKKDPGPAFPLDTLRNKILPDRDSEEPIQYAEASVNTERLNIREMPNVQATTVSDPLREGTKLKILQEYEGWYRVKAEIEGWVSGDYVEIKK